MKSFDRWMDRTGLKNLLLDTNLAGGNEMKLPDTLENREGQLYVDGVSARSLADRWGTPLYVMSETALRSRMREFREAMASSELETEVIYASKAFLCKAMVRLVADEGLSMDVVSGGELYTALSAGFDPARIYFHGNNKSEAELALAVDSGVGCVILDNALEAARLVGLLAGSDRRQRVLLRVNPGIEAHTHEFISTTKNDSKFGLSIFQDETQELLQKLATEPNLVMEGLHCHIGSQIFEESSFHKAAEVMLDYIASLAKAGVELTVLNLGGGFGVRYVEGDEPVSPKSFLPGMLEHLTELIKARGLEPLKILIEPGRAIAANAGLTLYTIGGTKQTFGGKNYVFVDGSMADHIRTALYDASYEAALAERLDETVSAIWTVTGKACESGDILVRDIALPQARQNELLAVFSTGAYHYSMASNYNRLPRPAVVLVKDGRSRLAVQRETYEDLIRNDIEEDYTE